MAANVAALTALIVERPMCMDCLCDKTGVKPEQAKATLALIGRTVKVHHLAKARCRSCGEDRPAVSIDAPSG